MEKPTAGISFEQVRRTLLEAREVRERLERVLEDFDLSYGQFTALDAIVRHGPFESMAVAETAWEKVDYSRISQLTEMGYARRKPSAEDGRKKLVEVTEPGKRLYYRITDRVESFGDELES